MKNVEARNKTQPNLFNQLLLICQFELKRLFFTQKGLLYLITFAVVWYFILLYPVRFAADILVQEQMTRGSHFFELIGFGSLMNWKIPELGVYWRFALVIFPVLSIVIAADQTCSDRQRGTLRFLVLRTRREGIFFGRFMGVMIIQATLVMVTLISTLVLVAYRDTHLLTIALNGSLAIAVNLLLVLLPFTAMMAVLSATVKSVRQASVWAILIWSFSSGIISILGYYLPGLDSLKIMIPGYQMAELAQLAEWDTLRLAYIPLLQTLILLAAGRWVMSRQAL